MAVEVTSKLLNQYKLSIGDLTENDNSLDGYYTNFLSQAIADLETDDISEDNLNSAIGQNCIILYAKDLMDGINVMEDNVVNFYRSKLATMTKGDRFIKGQNNG